jgi:succinoglycan biosynthesis transport protein ExoP
MDMNIKNSGTVEVIDLGHYWSVVRRQFKKIIALSSVTTLISILVVLSLTPKYSATSTLLIEASESKVLSIEEVYGLSGNGSEYFLTQFEILKSRDMASRVVEKLNLVNSAEFNPFHASNKKSFSIKASILAMINGEPEPPTEKQILASTVDNFWSVVSIEPVRKTQLVKISVESANASFAPIAANAIADAYIESQLEAKVGLTKQAADWLGARLGGLKEKLNISEHKLQEFREKNNLIDVKGVTTLVTKELDQVAGRLVSVRIELLDFKTSYNQLQSLKDMSYNSLSSLPFIFNNPLVIRLKESESTAGLKVSELSDRYGAKHPKMMAARSDLKAVRESLLTQMELIADGIENDYSAAKSKERSLVEALDETKARMLSINRTEFELSDYVRNVRANRALYETFFTRINETAETSTLRTANARIVDAAIVPKEAFKPKKKLIVMLVLVVSLMFGVALAFLLDALDSTIKHADDVDYKLNTSMLGLLPLLPASKDKASKDKASKDKATLEYSHVTAFMHGDHAGFKESVRTLRTSITLASLEKPVQTLLFTSSVPSEGKTTSSVNLACAYGQMEKVLLIDADMRRPTVAKQLRLPQGSRGLSNAVAYPEMLDDSIHSIENLGIDVMPAGAIPPNPLELLSSKNFSDILETLKTRYTKIIIDSAPMQAVSDALYLSTLTDGIVYVVKADATRDKFVKAGLSRLDDANARILGVVLNQVDVEKEARYGGTYGGYYDNYNYNNS